MNHRIKSIQNPFFAKSSLPRYSRYVDVHAWSTKDFLNERQCTRSESKGKSWVNPPNLHYWWLGWSRDLLEGVAALQMQTMSIDRWRTNLDADSCLFTGLESTWSTLRTIGVVTWFRQCHWSYGIGQRWTCGQFTAKGSSICSGSKRSDPIISTFAMIHCYLVCGWNDEWWCAKEELFTLDRIWLDF